MRNINDSLGRCWQGLVQWVNRKTTTQNESNAKLKMDHEQKETNFKIIPKQDLSVVSTGNCDVVSKGKCDTGFGVQCGLIPEDYSNMVPKQYPDICIEHCNTVLDHHIADAQIIWGYLKMGHTLQRSDLILVLGNHDVRTAEYACGLWKEGWARRIMFSGNLGNLTLGHWSRPEADVFFDIAMDNGIPPDNIILEKHATNTGENISLSYKVLADLNLIPTSIILVQMPFMERRSYATFIKQWPDSDNMSVCVTSPDISMLDYPNEDVGSLCKQIKIMLGCLQRIRKYPSLGYQIEQDIPNCVSEAYHKLVQCELYRNNHSNTPS